MARVELKNLRKTFGSVRAVDRLDIVAEEGGLLVLLGPSGCGKTTTLRMVAGLERPDSGEVWIGDKRVDALPPQQRDVAMVFQSHALYPHLTVAGNLGFGLKMRGVARDETAARIEEAAAMLQLGDLLNRRPAELSGGEQQRVALGRAIVRKPALFLLDEPLSNLDSELRREMRTELVRIQRELDTTMIYVTHDQTEAMMMGTHVAVMKDGKIHQVGSPRSVYQRPRDRFVAGFVGSPAMNFFAAQVTAEGKIGEVMGKRFPLPTRVAAEKVTVGVRPESIRVQAENSEGAGELSFPAQVEMTQLLGADLLITMRTDRFPLVALLRADDLQPEALGRVTCDVDYRKLHIFDHATGRRIDPTAGD